MTSATRRAPRAGELSLPLSNLPVYELRRKSHKGGAYVLEIWQLPSPATPRLDAPEHVGSLGGTPLRLLEARLTKRLTRAGINLSAGGSERERRWPLDEEQALAMGLLFRALAPMRNLDRIRLVEEGIEAMSREEAGYWLGMSMHRKNPRRVLAALRILMETS